MNITKTIFFFFFIANMNLMVRADEEDDFGELLLDFGSGVAVAACEAGAAPGPGRAGLRAFLRSSATSSGEPAARNRTKR